MPKSFLAAASMADARGQPCTLQQRCRGAMLGMALGDALGTAIEFMPPPKDDEALKDIVGGGVFSLLPGQWTDDTSFGLCLAESLIRCDAQSNAEDQLDTYVRWNWEGHHSSNGRRFDIGNATKLALDGWKERREQCSTGDNRGSNGSLMRLAPAAIAALAQPDLALAASLCGETSRTTHDHPKAVDACRYYGALILGALRGVSKQVLLSPAYLPDARSFHPDVARVAAAAHAHDAAPPSDNEQVDGRKKFGGAPKALEAALWAFARTDSFKEGALLVANLGGDADTTAAIYGQLAGAFYGEAGLPRTWLDKLVFKPMLVGAADALCALTTRKPEPAMAHTAAVGHWNALLDVQTAIEQGYSLDVVLRLSGTTVPWGKGAWLPKGDKYPNGYASVSELKAATAAIASRARAAVDPSAHALVLAVEDLLQDWGRQWQKDAEELAKAFEDAPKRTNMLAGIAGFRGFPLQSARAVAMAVPVTTMDLP